jgi:hypothetical protein
MPRPRHSLAYPIPLSLLMFSHTASIEKATSLAQNVSEILLSLCITSITGDSGTEIPSMFGGDP